ncbi:MAG: cell division protein FtsH, partial [Alphaproteobacteria bacterium]|nr:cell division protein FtsH [Alphaproteobacteria bacterium]
IIARGTPGFSGADLANLVNEAALLAARKNKRVVGMDDFEEAKDKVMMGAERRSMVMTDDEKKLTAYHEAGHAIVALNEPESDPIHKATIVPRGRALGMVMRLPEGDRVSMSKAKLEADLAVAMGGRIAEELIFGAEKVTTGASSDIKMATDIARRMVTEWGMSSKLGPLRYAGDQEEVFLGHSVSQTKTMSDETANVVDSEIRRIVEQAYARATEILNDKLSDLHTLAKALLEYELLSGDEIRGLLRGEPILRDNSDDEPTTPKSSVPKGGGLGGLPQGA